MAKRILIVRLSALGDVVMSSGLIPALRARFPDAQLSWLVDAPAAPLLQGHPQLHQLLVLPRAALKQAWRNKQYRQCWQIVRDFIRQLRAEQFDLAIDAQGLLKSALWPWLAKIPRRIGFFSKERSHWLATEVLVKVANDPDFSSEYRQIAEYLAAPAGSFQLTSADSPNAEQAMQARWQQLQATSPELVLPPLVICPFTTRPQKHWHNASWQQFIDSWLSAHPKQAIIMLGGPGDRAAAKQLSAGVSSTRLLDWVGQTSIAEARAVLKLAQAVVGVDTGLSHLALSLAKPTVLIFGSTRPYSNLLGYPGTVLYAGLSCAPCKRKPSCDGRFDCMTAIAPEQVSAALQQALRLSSRNAEGQNHG